jgi:hypothetical protein
MPFNANRMLEYLASLKIGGKQGFQEFNNTVQWGKEAGSLRVELGQQYNLYLERLVHDIDGEPFWITKKVFKINTDEYKQYVESVADSIYEQIEKVANESLDGPQKKFAGILDLAKDISEEVNYYANEFFVLDHIRQLSENRSLLAFFVKGAGVGYLRGMHGGGRINQVLVDLNFNESTGLVHTQCCILLSGSDSNSWMIQPSFADFVFCPTQPIHEMSHAIVTALKWF